MALAFPWPGIVTCTFTALAFVFMAADWVGPDITFTVLLAFLTAFDGKIITVSKAAAGYGNTGLLTVIFLYLVAEGVTQTGGLELIMNYVLGRSRSVHWALVRSMFPVMILSAFLNNTPCVTFMIPILISWARRCGVPPKKLLIPLSYAAVLGGTCTSIGTSTNLVIVGLQETRYTKAKRFDEAKFRIFDIAPYGVPYALWGFIFIVATQATFGVSAALEGTGVAAKFANAIIAIGKDAGGTGAALIAIYIATALLSELLTNNAAGAIMYPIAAIAGDALKISPRDTSIAIMLGASAGFVNPFSYQCNLMVYAAGNYSVREFAIIGAPFQVYLMIVAGFILVYRHQWHQVWIVSWICTAAFVVLPALYLLLPSRILLRFEAAFERIGDALNVKKAIARRRIQNQRHLASNSSSSSLGSPNGRALSLPKVAPNNTQG
ncbi:hypothetical protein VOLCADRAFT_100805 [Volvox carteri f. nagariensis]|uniref:Citrate transporter-like domain-containing protein n=1 Tax=Volvox carteri f. nagariensis TaxID=3068 RepID=D8UL29_VOLCA|nr:uncharacterized protein VOLCADRAFT_100805 [Volvox carteri f. nagariensis]EFJ39565.1 hypothetical protein VOLCADRAFT_100805 [Volvox carteri f. nagariensis]|eukprot:XP_002959365.1 hypothetical protein VOLCADRAFT_100805 [Volvox carteri f. nagariensis]